VVTGREGEGLFAEGLELLALGADFFEDGFSGDAGEGFLTGGVDVGDEELVDVVEGGAELFFEQLSAAVAMGLEEAEDALGQWIEERCLLAKSHREGVSELFADWREWAERAGEYVGSVKRFSELMATRKFEKCRLTGGARAIAGIALRPKPYSNAYPYRDD
jgi:hypothetical protein